MRICVVTCGAGYGGECAAPEVVLSKDDLCLVLGDSLHLVGPLPTHTIRIEFNVSSSHYTELDKKKQKHAMEDLLN